MMCRYILFDSKRSPGSVEDTDSLLFIMWLCPQYTKKITFYCSNAEAQAMQFHILMRKIDVFAHIDNI